MAPSPPSRRRGFQFRAEELDDLMDLVESFLPISAQNWQAVADVHLENYRREARTAESLRRKFQEISRRTGPTGDPNCPPYVIKAKRINRQLVQMIDASSGGSEAGRSDDGLSDTSDSEYEGAGEFANVMNEMNNAAANGGEEEIDEEEDADDAGIGVQGGLVWRADEGQPSAADDDGVVGAVAGEGDAPPDGVAPAVARPARCRGPGRSRTHPASAAGVICPPPAAAAVGRKAARLLPRRLHAMAATAKCLGPVGQRQHQAVIEDVRFAHRSTAEGRRAALTMTTMAVFLCQTLWG